MWHFTTSGKATSGRALWMNREKIRSTLRRSQSILWSCHRARRTQTSIRSVARNIAFRLKENVDRLCLKSAILAADAKPTISMLLIGFFRFWTIPRGVESRWPGNGLIAEEILRASGGMKIHEAKNVIFRFENNKDDCEILIQYFPTLER